MAKKKFVEEFDVQIETPEVAYVSDYEAFPNKILLDELRTKIIQNLIDNNITKARDMTDFVKTEIDKTIDGYDLSNVERSYLYNLIDNEISGNGPLTELLEDHDITEIMVNGKDEIYIELEGRVVRY